MFDHIKLSSMIKNLSIQETLLTLLALVVTFAIFKAFISRSSGIRVGRGKESWKVFGTTFTVLFAAYVFTISNSAYTDNTKVIYYILSLIGIAYLCFDSHWFQNKIMGIYASYTNKKRGHS